MLRLIDVSKTFRPSEPLTREAVRLAARLLGRRTTAEPEGVQAVRGISLHLPAGRIIGLVGESGSGKSTLGRIMAGLYRPDSGHVLFRGRKLDQIGPREFSRRVQIMFQDPVSSLNPRHSAGFILEEGLAIHRLLDGPGRRAKAARLLDEVGLPRDSLSRYPHQFSGGQRQRLSLARSLTLDPELLIADEPVSALDVSIQAQVINLLLEAKTRRGLTLLVISHDLPLVRLMADRLAVMYGGRLMEELDKNDLGRLRHHPYLLSLIASAEGGDGSGFILAGEPPDPANPPPGCPFQPRCPETRDICRRETPSLTRRGPLVCACHFR